MFLKKHGALTVQRQKQANARLMSGVEGKKARKFKKRRRQPTGLRSCVCHRVYLYYYKESDSSGSGQRNAYFQIICSPRGERGMRSLFSSIRSRLQLRLFSWSAADIVVHAANVSCLTRIGIAWVIAYSTAMMLMSTSSYYELLLDRQGAL